MLKDNWFHEDRFPLTVAFKTKKVLYSGKSKYQKIDVIETECMGNLLLLDDTVMTTDKDEFYYHESIAHLSMAIHPNPKKVMVIGGGDGGTAREVLKYNVDEVEMVEIDEEVIEVSKKFFPEIASEFGNPKLKVKVEDAIEYVKNAKENNYDVILCDSTDPEGFAAGLISEEYYKNVSKALKKDGIYISQSGSLVIQENEFSTSLKNLRSAFKYVDAAVSIIPTYPGSLWAFLIASNSPITSNIKSMPKGKTRYWSSELHEKLFIKPNWLKEKYFQLESVK